MHAPGAGVGLRDSRLILEGKERERGEGRKYLWGRFGSWSGLALKHLWANRLGSGRPIGSAIASCSLTVDTFMIIGKYNTHRQKKKKENKTT